MPIQPLLRGLPPFAVSPYLIGAGIAVALLVVATGATWIRARRAATVDPVTTLRLDA